MWVDHTGKNNRFPFLDILGYKEYPQKSQIWKSETSPNQGTWLGIPWLGLVSLCQIWDFYGYSLNTLKYPKMGICYFFLCHCSIISQTVQVQYIHTHSKKYVYNNNTRKEGNQSYYICYNKYCQLDKCVVAKGAKL